MAILYLAIASTACNDSVYGVIFVPMFISSMDDSVGDANEKTSTALLAMLGLGAGEIIGAIAFGIITDKCTKRTTVLLNVLAVTVGFGFLFNYRMV